MISMQQWGKNHKKWPGYVTVKTSAVCGFMNSFLGSCSLLEIQLEKPVKLPLNVLEINPDGVNGYGIYQINSLTHDWIFKIWKSDCIEHWGLPRGFRRDAALMGIEQLPSVIRYSSS